MVTEKTSERGILYSLYYTPLRMQNLSEYTILDGLDETDTFFDLLNENLDNTTSNTSQAEVSEDSRESPEALVTEFVFEV